MARQGRWTAYKQSVDVRCFECLAGAWGAAGVRPGHPLIAKTKRAPVLKLLSELPGTAAQCEWGAGWAVQGASPCVATHGTESWPLIATVSHVGLRCARSGPWTDAAAVSGQAALSVVPSYVGEAGRRVVLGQGYPARASLLAQRARLAITDG